jgi:site-specific recombinase
MAALRRGHSDLFERVLWLEHILRWLKGSDGDVNQSVRLRYLLQTLEKNPQWKSNVAAVLRSLLRDSSGLRLFLQTGFAIEGGLWGELVNRFFQRFLPQPPENDLLEIVIHSLPEEEDAVWIRGLPTGSVGLILELINYESNLNENWDSALRVSLRESLLILSANIAHYSFTSGVRQRSSFF